MERGSAAAALFCVGLVAVDAPNNDMNRNQPRAAKFARVSTVSISTWHLHFVAYILTTHYSTTMSQPESLLPKERIERNLALHRAAGAGDMIACETLLSITQPDAEWNGSADAWYADEAMLGWDALHYAADGGHPDIIKLLLKNGALWNAVDELGFTAADIAWSRNYTKCYDILFQEGVRQSFLVPVIARHAKLDEKSMDTHAEHQASREDENGSTLVTLKSGSQEEVTYSNAEFLKSKLTFMKDENGQWRCLDKDNNMVMAEWENEIMHASAKVLCEDQPRGFSILNVGFGLGIIDEMIQTYKPRRHVIIEPHPDAIAFMREQGWDQRAGVEIFEGTWEDFLQPENDEDGSIAMKLGVFDAIYFDTYSQDYQGTCGFAYAQIFDAFLNACLMFYQALIHDFHFVRASCLAYCCSPWSSCYKRLLL